MQRAYFAAFPGIPAYQRWIIERISQKEPLVNPLGVEAKLFGRPDDTHTHNQGLAFMPQSMVGHIVAIATWRIFRELDPHSLLLLAQVHDAILFEFPIGSPDIPRKAFELMRIPCEITDIRGKTRTMVIEPEAAIGQNWGKRSDTNPGGLVEVDFARN